MELPNRAEFDDRLFPALARRTCGGIAYFDGGKKGGEGETAVFLHGVGLRAEYWTPQIRAQKNRRRMIAVDLPGHGDSPMPRAPTTMQSYSRPLLALLDSLALPKVFLIGHSLGALAAVDFALRHPPRVSRLAALNMVFRRDPAAAAAAQRRSEIVAAGGDTAAATLKRWFGEAVAASDSAAHDAAARWLHAAPRAGYAAAYRVFAAADQLFVDTLQNLKMPALFMTGEFDVNSPPQMSEQCAVLAARGESVTIGGARHLTSLTHPVAVNRRLFAPWTETLTEIH